MKAYYAVLLALVLGVWCVEKAQPKVKAPPKIEPESVPVVTVTIDNPIVDRAIRKQLKKPTGKLTEGDMEKVTRLSLQRRKLTKVPKELENLTQLKVLDFRRNQLTDLKGLEKLTQLEFLMLTKGNFALTQAQIDKLQKALPKCYITSNPTK